MLGLAAFVVSGACLPHLHASGEFGLWNEEHDLSLMAALGPPRPSSTRRPSSAPARARADPGVGDARAVSAPLCLTDPRAPPLASLLHRSRRSGSPTGRVGRTRPSHSQTEDRYASSCSRRRPDVFRGAPRPAGHRPGSRSAQEGDRAAQEAARVGDRTPPAARGSASPRDSRLAPPPVPSPTGPPAMAPPQPPGASLTELARRASRFRLYQQRGAGQLLFDIGIAGDFVGNITQSNVEKARRDVRRSGESLLPREVELSLFGQVDPYAYAEVRIETGEEARGQELGVKLAEASVTLLTLPLGTRPSSARCEPFRYSNMIHEHDLPWIDRPNVLRKLPRRGGSQRKGRRGDDRARPPFYLEGLAGVFDGDNETAFAVARSGSRSHRPAPDVPRARRRERGASSACRCERRDDGKQRDTLLGWRGATSTPGRLAATHS